MNELNKKLHVLKTKIRTAINESGLALEVVDLVLESVRTEVLQNELFAINNSLLQQPESEVAENDLCENTLDKQ